MRGYSIKAVELEESSQDELIQEKWGEASWGSQFSVWPAQSFLGEIGGLWVKLLRVWVRSYSGNRCLILSQYSEFGS